MARLGIFGGTFDPPHLGHLILAMEAFSQLGLDQLLWVVTPDPPHKTGQNISPASIRLRMVEKAVSQDPHFKISTVDLDRPGPHFAVDTLHILRDQYPGMELVYIIGGDSLHDLPKWHQPVLLLKALDFLGVMRRPDDDVDLTYLEEDLPNLSDKILFIDAPLLEISSSRIRDRVMRGLAFRYYVPEPVFDMIIHEGLYMDEMRT